jgi:hypothetical protein
METPDWTTTEYLANLAAEELGKAFTLVGIGVTHIAADEGDVIVYFDAIEDAEAMMTLAVGSDNVLGGLYDRATSSCITLGTWDAEQAEPTQSEVEAVINAGWTWQIHPTMNGRRMGWHVRLDLPHADANQLTANLNALRLGGLV